MAYDLAKGLRIGRAFALSGLAMGALAAPAAAAEAAATCAPRAEIVKTLASNFNEKPLGMGLSGTGSLVVIFTSPAGTWTAATVTAAGQACIVGAGDGWTDLAPPVGVMAQTEAPATR